MKLRRQVVPGSQDKDFHVLKGPEPDKHQFGSLMVWIVLWECLMLQPVRKANRCW